MFFFSVTNFLYRIVKGLRQLISIGSSKRSFSSNAIKKSNSAIVNVIYKC